MQYYCFLRKIARSAFEKTKDDLLIFSAIIRNYRVIPFLNNLHPRSIWLAAQLAR
jgi:hypothetical protein